VKNPNITEFAKVQDQYANLDEKYLIEIKETMHHYLYQDELTEIIKKTPQSVQYENLPVILLSEENKKK